MQSPRCTVGADSISARFAAARGLREGHAPPLHAVRERPAKWDCRGHPGERRAGCPHPAGPRGGGNVPGFEFQRCGGRKRPPYGPGETRRPPGKCNPPRCTVGADSISARFAAAQGSTGGINPAPTGKFCVSGKSGRPRCLPRFAGEGHGPPAGVRGRADRADMESAPTWGVCGGAGFAGGACPSPTCRPGTTGQMGLPRPPGRT